MDADENFVVPSLEASIGEHIDCIEGAIVVPPLKDDKNRSVQRSGVLYPDGRMVENAITWRGTSRVTLTPAMPKADEIKELSGSYMFLGPLFGHFGHFLVESICRIWAFDRLRNKLDGVLYVPKFQNRPEHVMNVYRPFLEALGVTAPAANLSDPTRVERLYVPRQGFGMFQMIEGAPEFREFVRKHAGKSIAPKGAKKLYISRSALPAERGSILREDLLEEHLAAEGYAIFHPQKHSHADQIAAYRAARQIVAIDCSPLHLLALVGDAGQSVAVIARRNGDLDQIFARQIRSFQGASAFAFNFLKRNWIEKASTRPSRTSWGEIDFAGLYHGLYSAGFLMDATPWPTLRETEVTAAIKEIENSTGNEFRSFEDG